MKFYESPYYLQAVEELGELSEKVEEFHKIQKVMGLLPDVRKEFLHTLYALIEKEQTLWTRLSLDGTPEAHEIMKQLHVEAVETGMPPHHSLPTYHMEMKEEIRVELESLGEKLDEEVDLD